jgi:serine/threonine protein kinase
MAAARSPQYLTVLRCELRTNGVPSVALVRQWEPCGIFGQASPEAKLCSSGKLYNQSLAFKWNDYIVQCLDVAEGLEYLHSQDLIHGDMKGVSRTIK